MKRSWTKAEDALLCAAIKDTAGKVNWGEIAKGIPNRTAGACQGRWNTTLDPLVDRSPWTDELDQQLLLLYSDPQYNSWSKRAKKLAEGKQGPNGETMRRSGADVCNRYFQLIKRTTKPTSKKRKAN